VLVSSSTGLNSQKSRFSTWVLLCATTAPLRKEFAVFLSVVYQKTLYGSGFQFVLQLVPSVKGKSFSNPLYQLPELPAKIPELYVRDVYVPAKLKVNVIAKVENTMFILAAKLEY